MSFRRLIYCEFTDELIEITNEKDFEGLLSMGCDDVTDVEHCENNFKKKQEKDLYERKGKNDN